MVQNTEQCGLILRFQKRQAGASTDPSSASHRFTMFGYYDDLEILKVKHWFDFSPRGMEEAMKKAQPASFQTNVDTSPVDFYDVKLLFPGQKIRDNLSSEIFDYKTWNNKDQDKDSPFLSVVLLRATDAFLSTLDSPQDGIEKLVTFISSAKDSHPIHKDDTYCWKLINSHTKCAVFSTLGSFDYAILFRGNDLETIFHFTEKLRTEWKVDFPTTDSGDLSPQAVSNIYMTQGFQKNADPSQFSNGPCMDRNVPLQIRMRLLPGMKVPDLLTQLRERMTDLAKNRSFQHLESWLATQGSLEAIKHSAYLIRGRYDCQLCLDLPLKVVVDLYCDRGLFSSQNITDLSIEDIHTTIRFPVMEDGASMTTVMNLPKEFLTLSQRFKTTQKVYQHFLETNHLHFRTERAISQMFVLFCNMHRNPHNRDVSRLLCNAFDSLLEYLESRIACANQALNKHNEANFYHNVEEIERGAALFREYIGNYLLDLAHSERGFIEGLKLSHSSVESATKLLFAYNSILNQLVQCVSRPSSEGEFRYTFVVVSGGCDQTKAITLFDTNTEQVNDLPKENRLFVIQLSEMSIFDIKGTLLRTVHEAWHFCGNRLRRERKTAWIDAISQLLAYYMAQVMFAPFGPIQAQIVKETYTLSEDSFHKELSNLQATQRNFLQTDIAAGVRKHLTSACTSEKETELLLYADELLSSIKMALLQWLTSGTGHPQPGGTDALSFVYAQYQNHFSQWLDSAIARCNSPKYQGFTYPLLLRKSRTSYFQTSAKDFDQPLCRYLTFCLTCFACNEVDIPTLQRELSIDDADIHKLWDLLSRSHIHELCRVIQSGCNEALSDIMAIQTLGATVEEYLFSFLYECWHINQSLPKDLSYTFRIGLTMDCCFHTCQLTDSIKQTLRRYCDSQIQSATWMSERFHCDALIERIEQMLNQYNYFTNKQVTPPLKKYLESCLKTLEQLESEKQETLKRIRRTYQSLPNPGTPSEAIPDCVDSILLHWLDLNKPTEEVEPSP